MAMAMATAVSASAGKRGRDERMTAAADSSVEGFRYQSKRLRQWLELQQDYLLNQNDEFNEQHVAAHGNRLLEIIKSLQDEIGVPAQSGAPPPPPPPPLQAYASSQILGFHIGPEEDALTLCDEANSDCHGWDLKASRRREITLPRPSAGKRSMISPRTRRTRLKEPPELVHRSPP